jgi:O-antigen/teichoic acid export membrane protein
MFAFLFAVLLLPMYSRMPKLGEKIRPMLEISSRLLLGTGVFVAILFFFNGEWLLRWRYDSVTENAVYSFIALMVGFVGVCMFYIYGTLMTANENLRPLNYISFGGLLLNIILNFLLIPRYAAFGAALTTMITQIFAGQMQMLFVIRQFNLGVNMRLVRQFVIFILTFIVANYVIVIWVESLAFRFFISAATGCALLLLSRTIQIRQIWILLRAEK